MVGSLQADTCTATACWQASDLPDMISVISMLPQYDEAAKAQERAAQEEALKLFQEKAGERAAAHAARLRREKGPTPVSSF